MRLELMLPPSGSASEANKYPVVPARLRVAVVSDTAAQDAFDRVEFVLDPRLAQGESIDVGRLALQRESRLEGGVACGFDRAQR